MVMAGVGITVSRSMTEKSQLEITFPYVLSSSVLSACGGHILLFFPPLLSVAPVALGLGAGAGRAGCSRGCVAAVGTARERGAAVEGVRSPSAPPPAARCRCGWERDAPSAQPPAGPVSRELPSAARGASVFPATERYSGESFGYRTCGNHSLCPVYSV